MDPLPEADSGTRPPVDAGVVLEVNAGADTVLCAGGAVEIGPEPVAGYVYAWTPTEGLSDPTAAKPTASPTATTTYRVTVTDPARDITGTDEIVLTVNPLPVPVITLTTGAPLPAKICGAGTLTLSAASSTGAAGLTAWSWDFGGTTADGQEASFDLAPAAQVPVSLSVTDANGCTASTTAQLEAVEVPVANAGPDKLVGLGGEVMVGAPASGGTAPYTYAWTSNDAACTASPCISDASVEQPLVSPAATTLFSVVATDANGCSSAPDSVEVAVTNALVANAGTDLGICAGDSATIGLPAGGGVAPYTYAWSASPTCDVGTCLSDSAVASPTVTPTQDTTFTQLVTDTVGGTASATVQVLVAPDPGTAGSDVTLLPGSSLVIGPSNPLGSATYQWSCNRTDCALNSDGTARPIASPVRSTTYTLTASSSTFCTRTSQLTLWVSLVPSSVPSDGEPAFPVSSLIQVQFDRDLLASSVNATNVLLEDAVNGALIPTTVAYDPATRIVTITPPAPGTSGYVAGSDYTLTLRGGPNGVISDDPVLPNRLPSDLLIDFTSAGVDTTAPAITFRSPAAGAVDVPTNSVITVTFNEPVNAASVNATSFTVADGAGTAVPGTVTYDFVNRTATFSPAAALAAGASFTVSLTGVTDLSGNALTTSWTFATAAAPDLTPPTVASVNPADGANGVMSSSTVQVTFSEAVDPATLTGFTLINTVDGTSVGGAVTWNPTTLVATFTPAAPLLGSTTYQVRVTGVTDLVGNAMAAPFTSTFLTRLTVFFDNFENGLGNWTTSSWGLTTASFQSATHSLTDSPVGKYLANTSSSVELTNPLQVAGLSSLSLQFGLRTRMEKNKDFFYVDYRVDGGAWVTVNKPGTNGAWTGSSGWTTFSLSLPVTNASTLQLRFRLTSNATRNFDGVYVDDVLVQAQ